MNNIILNNNINHLVIEENTKQVFYQDLNNPIKDLDIISKEYSESSFFFYNSALNLKAKLLKGSTVHIYNIVFKDQDLSCNISVNLEEQDANIYIMNVVLATNQTKIESNIYINHNGLSTNSDNKSYAIVKDEAIVTLNNNATIKNGMHQSNAMQGAKGLTLSKDAKIFAEPNLFIDEYDVKASHAVAIGSINQDELYYLMSRGLSKNDASIMIVKGFIAPILKEIEDEKTKEYIYQTFNQMLQ